METTRSADGTTIAFDRLGDGPPLVLLPGAMCTRGVTAPLAAALSAHLTVLNVDRRGRGDSDDRSTAPPWLVEREVEDVAAVVAAAGGSAAVYGHSSGAALALHAAAAVGIGVTRLVLHDAPFSLPGGEEPARDWDVTLRRLLGEGRDDEAVETFLLRVGVPEPVVRQMRTGPQWGAMAAVAPTLAYDSAAMGDREGGLVPQATLARVGVPALVVVGEAGHPFMRQVADALVAGLPDARATGLAGAGHDAGPDVVAPAMLPFVLG
jgi:pimeloyl-ACP methyl ester carboxylesterase